MYHRYGREEVRERVFFLSLLARARDKEVSAERKARVGDAKHAPCVRSRRLVLCRCVW